LRTSGRISGDGSAGTVGTTITGTGEEEGLGGSIGWEHGHDTGHLTSPSDERGTAAVGQSEHGPRRPSTVGLLYLHIPGGFELGHVTAEVPSCHTCLVLEVDEVGLFKHGQMSQQREPRRFVDNSVDGLE